MTEEIGTAIIVPDLEDGVVLLRPLRDEDAVTREALGRDPEIHRLMGWDGSGGNPPFTAEDAAEWMEQQRKSPHCWAITLATSPDRLLGSVRLMGVNDDLAPGRRTGNLGIGLLDPAALDRGLGMRAMRLILAHAFGPLGLHRVGLRVLAFNARGIHCYEKLGFQVEGREREAYSLLGLWHDNLVMGLLAPEYFARKGQAD
ncbi:MAG: GNAT family protein [Azospirillaceae bacterium]|nr:GNAT family protein [Azospirillaceae bacterium]